MDDDDKDVCSACGLPPAYCGCAEARAREESADDRCPTCGGDPSNCGCYDD